MDGIIVVDKPKGWTSRDVVNHVSKILHTKKIGHTGTLDPLATGTLVLCVGKAVKIAELLTSMEKEYLVTAALGIQTDTLDCEGTIQKQIPTHLTKEQIEKTLKKFEITYQQEVPIYSAVKVNGKKLYEYARAGQTVSLPKKEVTIKKLSLTSEITYEKENTIFSFSATVSKGTYIRSLVRDIASSLKTVGIMTELRRTKQGNFTIKQASTIKQIEKGEYQLLPLENILPYPKVEVTEELEFKIKKGQKIQKEKEDIVCFVKNGKVLAIYKETEDKKTLKPWKMILE